MRSTSRFATVLTLVLFGIWGIAYLFVKDSLSEAQLAAFILLPFLVIMLVVSVALVIVFHTQEKQEYSQRKALIRAKSSADLSDDAEKTPISRRKPTAGPLLIVASTLFFLLGATAIIIWGPAAYHAYFDWLDAMRAALG